MTKLWLLKGAHNAPGWKNLEADSRAKKIDVFIFDRDAWALVYGEEGPTEYEGLVPTVPQDGIYVYFRYDDRKTIMVVMNNNREEKSFTWDRFAEATSGFAKARNVMDGTEIVVGEASMLPPRSAGIYELF